MEANVGDRDEVAAALKVAALGATKQQEKKAGGGCGNQSN